MPLRSLVALGVLAVANVAMADDVVPPLSQRFASGEKDAAEAPDFQRHVVPLLGRLGCNGRACHGSFQGRGGFQLSLFGYDFKADHEALLEENAGRVDVEDPLESLILVKPTDADMHEGGQRYETGSWQYHVLRRWIESGAAGPQRQPEKLVELRVTPSEIHFRESNQDVALRAVAVWEDGTQEDVTELCRFSTNDEAVAKIDERGHVASAGSGDTHVVVYYDNAVVPIPVLRPVSDLVGDRYPQVETSTRIDELVARKLAKLGIVPSETCSDEEFLRRVSLDLTGTLPSPTLVKEFLADEREEKRALVVERLLQSPSYAAWWATRLSDWTGNNSDQLNNLVVARNSREAAARHWYGWLHQRIEQNVPYDEIVEGLVNAVSRKGDESYLEYCEAMSEICRSDEIDAYADRPGVPYYWGRANFRAVEDRATGFAYNFLGLRIQCAQCHKHPFDQWSKDDFDEFAKLFAGPQFNQNTFTPEGRQQKDEMLSSMELDPKARGNQLRRELASRLNEGEVIPFSELQVRNADGRNRRNRRQRNASVPTGRLLGGETLELRSDVRPELMEWLRSPENPYFAKAFVNRVWANYFGRGIVDPVDDLNLANPPSNAALMDELADGFIDSGFDIQWLHRTIIASDTYQRSSAVNETNRFDTRNFSRFVPRRLPAEVLVDAVRTATSGDAEAERLIACETDRSVLYVETPNQRNRGLYALDVFGRSTRESNCDCDRSDEPSLLQTVYLRNDSDVHQAILDRKGWVAEACRQLGVAGPQPARENPRAAQLQQQYDRLVQRRERVESMLVAAKQREGRPAAKAQIIKKLEQQLAEVGERLGQLERRGAGSPQRKETAAEASTSDLDAVISAAYLRTLSRYPTSNEQQRAAAFVRSSDSVADGLSGVLWALVNTKEFSLNH